MRNGEKKKRATYEDVLATPEGFYGEILDGELYITGRPRGEHGYFAGMLTAKLVPTFGQRDRQEGWWFLPEPELHLGEDILVPDLGGWRKERVPEPYRGAFTDVAPDWICEVLSPSTFRRDRAKKLPIYAREHVGHAWIIEPIERVLEVYRWHEGRWLLLSTFSREDKVRAEPFELLELPLAELWHPALAHETAAAPQPER